MKRVHWLKFAIFIPLVALIAACVQATPMTVAPTSTTAPGLPNTGALPTGTVTLPSTTALVPNVTEVIIAPGTTVQVPLITPKATQGLTGTQQPAPTMQGTAVPNTGAAALPPTATVGAPEQTLAVGTPAVSSSAITSACTLITPSDASLALNQNVQSPTNQLNLGNGLSECSYIINNSSAIILYGQFQGASSAASYLQNQVLNQYAPNTLTKVPDLGNEAYQMDGAVAFVKGNNVVFIQVSSGNAQNSHQTNNNAAMMLANIANGRLP